jgi:hypothetical protein
MPTQTTVTVKFAGRSRTWDTGKPVRETSPAKPGPRLEALPSLIGPAITTGINIGAELLNVAVLLIFGLSIIKLACIAIPLLSIWFMIRPNYLRLINERNEARARNLIRVEEFYSDNDLLDLVPPSDALAEREAQLESLYAEGMAAQGKLPNGDPLPRPESNRARKRRERLEAIDARNASVQVAEHEAEELKRKIIAAHRVPHAIHKGAKRPVVRRRQYEHDYECDAPAFACTCCDLHEGV